MSDRRFPILLWTAALVITAGLGWFFWTSSSTEPAPVKFAAGKKAELSLTASASSRSRAIEQDSEETRLKSSENAATFYRKAYALLDQLSQRENAVMDDRNPARPAPIAEEIAALLAKIRPIIALLREGSLRTECEWNDGELSIWNSPFQSTSKALLLAHVALWDASQRVKNQPQESVENFQAVDRLGNTIQAAFVGGLVNVAIHSKMAKFISVHGNEFSAAERKQLAENLASSELKASLQAAYSAENLFNRNTLESIKSGRKPDGTPFTPEEEKIHEALKQQYAGKLDKALVDCQNLGDGLKNSLDWSDQEFTQWMNQFKQTAAAPDNLPMYLMMRENMRAGLVRQKMTAAGLMVLDGGLNVLSQIKDPISYNSFSYKISPDKNSFELQSIVTAKGKPVSLTFQLRTGQ